MDLAEIILAAPALAGTASLATVNMVADLKDDLTKAVSADPKASRTKTMSVDPKASRTKTMSVDPKASRTKAVSADPKASRTKAVSIALKASRTKAVWPPRTALLPVTNLKAAAVVPARSRSRTDLANGPAGTMASLATRPGLNTAPAVRKAAAKAVEARVKTIPDLLIEERDPTSGSAKSTKGSDSKAAANTEKDRTPTLATSAATMDLRRLTLITASGSSAIMTPLTGGMARSTMVAAKRDIAGATAKAMKRAGMKAPTTTVTKVVPTTRDTVLITVTATTIATDR